jgi:hypothetical protein
MNNDGEILSVAPVKADSLWEIERAIELLLDQLGDGVPDDNDERDALVRMQIADLVDREASKVDAMARIVRRFKELEEHNKAESDRLADRAASFKRKRERLSKYVLDAMTAWDLKKLEGRESTMTRAKNPDSIEVERAELLPFEFQRWKFIVRPATVKQLDALRELLDESWETTISVEPDKAAVKHAVVNEGARFEAAVRVIPGGSRLSIK